MFVCYVRLFTWPGRYSRTPGNGEKERKEMVNTLGEGDDGVILCTLPASLPLLPGLGTVSHNPGLLLHNPAGVELLPGHAVDHVLLLLLLLQGVVRAHYVDLRGRLAVLDHIYYVVCVGNMESGGSTY